MSDEKKPTRILLIGDNSALQLLHMIEKVTTLPIIDVIDAVGDPVKEQELLHRMSENIRRENQ